MSLIITDNGQGFDLTQAAAESHYGLKFMRERIEQLNGHFTIWSKPGAGTRLTVCFPYAEEISIQPVSDQMQRYEQKVL